MPCTPSDVCSSSRSCNATRCRLLSHVCIVNETVHHRPHGGSEWSQLKARARVPWNSHHVVQLNELNTPSLASLPANPSSVMQDTSCAPPIVFVPTWSLNFADTVLSTVLPLLELQEWHGVSSPNSTTQLIADVLHKHMHAGCRSNMNMPCRTPSKVRTL